MPPGSRCAAARAPQSPHRQGRTSVRLLTSARQAVLLSLLEAQAQRVGYIGVGYLSLDGQGGTETEVAPTPRAPSPEYLVPVTLNPNYEETVLAPRERRGTDFGGLAQEEEEVFAPKENSLTRKNTEFNRPAAAEAEEDVAPPRARRPTVFTEDGGPPRNEAGAVERPRLATQWAPPTPRPPPPPEPAFYQARRAVGAEVDVGRLRENCFSGFRVSSATMVRAELL